MNFLTKKQVKELGDGAVVGFLMADKPYAAKISMSSRGVYLLQTRIPGGADCPDMKGMRFAWFVEWEQIKDYYMFNDEDVLAKLIDIDKRVAEYYRGAEQLMADYDKESVIAGHDIIAASLENKRNIAKEALEKAQKAADYGMSNAGIEELTSDLKKAADDRYNGVVASWDKKTNKEE